MLIKYHNDVNMYLFDVMHYDLRTFVRMTLEDKLCVVKINKQDRELLKQEDFENLTSYETESIKSETAYKFNLNPVPCYKSMKVRGVYKTGSRIFISDMNKRLTEAQLEEALLAHDKNLKENIELETHSESSHIKNLLNELERKSSTEFSFMDPSDSSSSSFEEPRYDNKGMYVGHVKKGLG